jgi:uncharacterized membrane protein
VSAVQSRATVNAIYRLGSELYARLPHVRKWAADLDDEWHWLNPGFVAMAARTVGEVLADTGT